MGNQVHGAFDAERRLRTAGTTVCASRSLIGQHTSQFYTDGGDMVWPNDTATDIEWRRRRGQEKIGPDVRHHVDAYPQEDAIASYCGFYVQAMASAMVRQHVFAPFFDPLDGTSEAYGEVGNQHVFGEQAIFNTKAASDIRRDHPHRLL